MSVLVLKTRPLRSLCGYVSSHGPILFPRNPSENKTTVAHVCAVTMCEPLVGFMGLVGLAGLPEML